MSNTSIPPEIIDRYLLESGILERVYFRVLSSETGWRKPHPAIYGEALDMAGVSPEETLFVGDRFLEDVAGPKSVGMKAALCRFEWIPFLEMSELSDEFMPDFQVSELRELAATV
ncbi:MAG TPA: HAD family hydrolase [Firmicutes bacterium]|nr:HAD family hydrolase [Candidatus Fermentithermobacillaceae bacterium]